MPLRFKCLGETLDLAIEIEKLCMPHQRRFRAR